MIDRLDDRAEPIRLLLLEDDDMLRDNILIPGLRDFGFSIVATASASDAARLLTAETFDLAVLDIGVRGGSGLDVLARARRECISVGTVMLTADGRRESLLRALDVGADAYLRKPVDIEILALTLRNLCARLHPRPRAGSPVVGPSWRLLDGGWCLEAPSGRSVALSTTERTVLRCLFAQAGLVVSRDVLIAALTEDVDSFDPHRLEMVIYRVRAKADRIRGAERELPLLASRGAGYLIAV